VKKDAFYFYKANWSSEPVLHVTSCRFAERTDPVTEVKVYSNASEVTLEVNGRYLGPRRTRRGPDLQVARGRSLGGRKPGVRQGAFWRNRGDGFLHLDP